MLKIDFFNLNKLLADILSLFFLIPGHRIKRFNIRRIKAMVDL
ncbi:MAG: hypothetical protein N2Z85_01445 [Patescibacteria group bacterium]|nr:hypothetical protein [Patescibacteria group bacterium]